MSEISKKSNQSLPPNKSKVNIEKLRQQFDSELQACATVNLSRLARYAVGDYEEEKNQKRFFAIDTEGLDPF